jgi:homogentisate phytyltransferase/homogentisate geranylgeranyltransferase
MKSILTLWKFSRPHTVIGSVISIYTLYTIVCGPKQMEHIGLLIMAIIVGITCNIFIVGINQIADIEIDKINKPKLPIPSGELSLKEANWIVYSSLLISLIFALIISPLLLLIIFLATFIGWAYSMPPIYMKRHHVYSAMAISSVRGVLINVGGFIVFNSIVNQSYALPMNVKILAVFIIVFSIVISWFKDLPDIAGDSQFKIKTFAIVYSPRLAWISGTILLSLAYLFCIIVQYQFLGTDSETLLRTKILLYGHLALWILFLTNSLKVQIDKKESIQKFYKRFWLFFFAEYLLYLIAYWN